MKAGNARRRGQPVVAFVGLMAFWLTVRVVATALPTTSVPVPQADDQIAGKGQGSRVTSQTARTPAAPQVPDHAWRAPELVPSSVVPALREPLTPSGAATAPGPMAPAFVTGQSALQTQGPVPAGAAKPNPTLAGGHQLLFLAAFSQLPLPDGIVPAASAPRKQADTPSPRWSGDGWLLLRRGGGAPALAAIGGSYGGSQAGMVLRYRLDRTSPLRPSAYLRASAALNGTREQEAALGLSARPIARMPVLAMAEVRATRSAAGTRIRPAAALVTQLAPFALPFRLTGEAYGQAGWVGGAGATAFAGGQLRIERPLAKIGNGELAAGGGAWGGAQKDASRLDIGPTARITLHPTEQSTLRVAADWRFRVAGNAAPQSGPAITLSAGF
jgi:hypothetical protein